MGQKQSPAAADPVCSPVAGLPDAPAVPDTKLNSKTYRSPETGE